MTNDKQAAIEALERIGRNFNRPTFTKDALEIIDGLFSTVRAALQGKPVDVALDDFIDYEDDKKCKWQSVTAYLHIPGALHSPEALEVAAFGSTEKEAKDNLLEIIQPIRDALNTPPQSPVTVEEAREALDNMNTSYEATDNIGKDYFYEILGVKSLETIRKLLQAVCDD